MPQFKYTGGYAAYYPDSGLFTKPGEVHTLDSAPDDRWQLADGSQSAPEAAPQTDAVAEAEALLEANPELAAKLVEEAKANA